MSTTIDRVVVYTMLGAGSLAVEAAWVTALVHRLGFYDGLAAALFSGALVLGGIACAVDTTIHTTSKDQP